MNFPLCEQPDAEEKTKQNCNILLSISKKGSPNISESATGIFTNVQKIGSPKRQKNVCLCTCKLSCLLLSSPNSSNVHIFCPEEKNVLSFICWFLTNMSQHEFLLVCVCIGLCASLCRVAVYSCPGFREINSFLQSTPACLHMLLPALPRLMAFPLCEG